MLESLEFVHPTVYLLLRDITSDNTQQQHKYVTYGVGTGTVHVMVQKKEL